MAAQQMDAEMVRERLREAAQKRFEGERIPGYASVASYTGPPANSVVLFEMTYGSDDGPGTDKYVQYPYRLVNQGGDAPRAEIDFAKGVEMAPSFRPLADFSKSVEGVRLAVKLAGGSAEEQDGKRTIKGYASVFGVPDRDDEVMEPWAFSESLAAFMNSPAMMFNHGMDAQVGRKRIGTWSVVKPDSHGLWVEGEFAKGDPDADRLWSLAEQGHINALSVGGRKYVSPGGRIVKWDLAEISVVAVPANPMATFEVAKNAPLSPDTLMLAVAHGRKMMEGDPAMTEKTPDTPDAPEPQASVVTLAPDALDALGDAIGKGLANAQKAAAEAEQKAAEEKSEQEKHDAEVAEKAVKEFEARLAERASKFGLNLPSLADLTSDDPPPSPLVAVSTKYDMLGAEDACYLAMARKAMGHAVDKGLLIAASTKAAKMYEAGTLAKSLGEWTHKAWSDAPDGKGSGEPAGGLVKAPWAMKADELMESDLAGYGDEWVPTLWTSQMWERIRMENAVLSFMSAAGMVVDMPSDPFTIPLEGSDPAIKRARQTTNASDFTFPGPAGISRAGTANMTMSTGKLMAVIPYTRELEEDAIIPIVPDIRRQTERAMEDGVESLIINGDTTVAANSNINDITGTPDAADPFLIGDGLRHLGLVTTTSDSLDVGTVTAAKIRNLRRLMGANGRMGMRPSELMMIVEGTTYYTLLGLDEVITADKYGPQATIRTGGLASIDDVRIHPSEQLALANATGKIDQGTPGNNTTGTILLFNRRQFRVGYRRRLMIEQERVPFADGGYLVASQRIAIRARDTEGVAVGFNVDV